MRDKEFVLVSQGIEIYRTKSQENAVNEVKKCNDEYFDYLQKCYDNWERPADNYVDLEIEYSNEKEKDKEIERLNNIINELEKELFIKKEFYERELTKRPTNDSEYNTQYADSCALAQICVIYDKLQELKGDGSND